VRRIGSADSGSVRKQSTRKNEVWGLDFIFDRTADGRPIKTLVVLDEYTREDIALEVSRKLKSTDVIMVLDQLTAIRGALENTLRANGSKFIADVMR
jgi:putative transposase